MKRPLAIILFMTAASAASAMGPKVSGPYDVVLPLIKGNPDPQNRVSGQMYFDVSQDKVKAIDNMGAVKTFTLVGDTGGGATVSAPAPTVTGGWDSVSFGSVNALYDTDSLVGTNRFVARRNGVHLITAKGNNAQEGSFVSVAYKVNGGTQSALCISIGAAGVYPLCVGSEQVMLSKGDTVEFLVLASSNNLLPLRLSIAEVGR